MFRYIAGAIVIGVGIWFLQPYSPIKQEFKQDVEQYKQQLMIEEQGDFTEADIENLPIPVQNYFRYCGFIGTPKMSYSVAEHCDAEFSLGEEKKNIKIQYTHMNFVKEPIRLAFIDSYMYGIPFQGYDSYKGGVGSMKGMLAKAIPLFDQRSKEMNQSSLVNVLAESLLCPNVALQPYIRWEAIDDTHAKATISYYGISAEGEFAFSEQGELLSFITEDRYCIDTNGTAKLVPWSAVLGDYREVNGIQVPATFQGIWHMERGNYIYFDGQDTSILFE